MIIIRVGCGSAWGRRKRVLFRPAFFLSARVPFFNALVLSVGIKLFGFRKARYVQPLLLHFCSNFVSVCVFLAASYRKKN